MALGDTGTAFATDHANLVAFNSSSGQTLWTYSAPAGHTISIVAALDANSGASIAINDPQAGITSFDANGNPTQVTTGSALSLASYSWNGSWDALSNPSATSGVVLPIEPDPISLWAAPLGNPSENVFGSPLDPSSFLTANPQPGKPACPICNLQPPNCLTMQGIDPSFLILVGDPGLNLGPDHNHNLGDLLNLAAQQKANDLNQQGLGSWVVACRVSSIQDFNAALTKVANGESFPGQITGGVFYFGHASIQQNLLGGVLIDEHSILAPGEQAGQNTNISDSNVQPYTAEKDNCPYL